MPLPDGLARFNRIVTNRAGRPLAMWMPGFGVVVHRGRNSGRPYRTPVNLFRSNGDYVIALTYGRERDWVRNVLAAGTCEVEHHGRSAYLVNPRIVTDERGRVVPAVVRPILRALGVAEFLVLSGGADARPPEPASG
jgi:deazaflavin-dependent oxidoreductase (nitroreductase family)